MFGKFEPILTATTLSSIVSAVLAVAVAFNVPITEEQRNALLGLVAVVGAIFWGAAAYSRNQVTPIEKVKENILPLVAPQNKAAAEQSLETGKPA
jgi:hypothetical protein